MSCEIGGAARTASRRSDEIGVHRETASRRSDEIGVPRETASRRGQAEIASRYVGEVGRSVSRNVNQEGYGRTLPHLESRSELPHAKQLSAMFRAN